jgi:hypothetical protein
MSDTPRYVRSKAILTREVEAALLLLVPGTSDVLSLSGSGPEIWHLLRSPRTLDDLVEWLTAQYDVDPASIEPAVRQTIDALLNARVLQRTAA